MNRRWPPLVAVVLLTGIAPEAKGLSVSASAAGLIVRRDRLDLAGPGQDQVSGSEVRHEAGSRKSSEGPLSPAPPGGEIQGAGRVG